MRSRSMLAAMTLAGLTFASPSAYACSMVVLREPTPAERRLEAEHRIEQATAVVDGEVVRPFVRGGEPALVRVNRVLKGGPREFVQVGEQISCDITLTRPGERLRLILIGGPEVFFFPDYLSNDVEEDRVLGSDRTRDWPYFAGN